MKRLVKRYLIDAMGSMALGLFASLLIGTIFSAIGMIPHLEIFATIGNFAKAMAGPAMGVSIAYSLGAHPLVMFSAAAVGYAANTEGGAGGPFAVFLIAIIAVEIGMLVSKKTKVDIIVTPFVTLLVGGLLSVFIAPFIGKLVGYVSYFIGWAATQAPLVTGLAGGAAVAGCCAQMVGFAVMSFRENGVGGLLSQGIGTSMLQMGNIIKNPKIWIPPILTSAITGPLATCVFRLEMNGEAIASGMGTCGLVGQIGVDTGWVNDIAAGTKTAITAMDWAGLILICFVLPAVLTWIFGQILRKIGWIKENDLKLD